MTVVDAGSSDEAAGPGLVEAARAEKARRSTAPHSKMVINNKNLHHYAKGQVTVAAPKKKPSPGVVAVAGAADPKHDETYWRQRGLEIRLRWRKATEQVRELEQSAADLRRRFYSQDDPYVRDGQIKPEWDRTLDRLREAQVEVDLAQRELTTFMEEGRREGAFPGWLREGAEQEPKPTGKPVGAAQAIEPPVKSDYAIEPPIPNGQERRP
ncbi:MAG: hypothetical protein M3O15_01140 [Acidobacteriota bacterium]|nr:hypothetical protein [Acidobacteriota bacterium]